MSTALLELNVLRGLTGPDRAGRHFLLFCVTDRPQLAHWLSDEERLWLTATRETEPAPGRSAKSAPGESFWTPKALWLSRNYFCVVTASVGTQLVLPNSSKVGWVTMIRYLCCAVTSLAHSQVLCSIAWHICLGLRSDRRLDIRHCRGREALLAGEKREKVVGGDYGLSSLCDGLAQ